jgi:hypothetical protein
LGPDEELLGVVVHSGLVLGRSDDVVAAIRRITAFPSGLALDTVVLARDIRAQAAGRREHAATAQRRAAETAQQLDEAAAQYDSGTEAQRDGPAAADRHHALKQAMIERRLSPLEGLLSLICSWPEVGLPETQTDLLLPDRAVRAAETFRIWDLQAPGADG